MLNFKKRTFDEEGIRTLACIAHEISCYLAVSRLNHSATSSYFGVTHYLCDWA